MRLLLTGCRLPQNREFVSAICSQNPVYPDQRVLRIAVPRLHCRLATLALALRFENSPIRARDHRRRHWRTAIDRFHFAGGARYLGARSLIDCGG